MSPFKMIELFAGIGGIRLGFDRAFGNDAETVFVSEIDKYAVQTYEYNFDTPAEIFGDIRDIDEKIFPPLIYVWRVFPAKLFPLPARNKALMTIITANIAARFLGKLCAFVIFTSRKLFFAKMLGGINYG